MDPLKCDLVFVLVSSRDTLSIEKGIDLDPIKAKFIQDMEPPITCKVEITLGREYLS